MAYLPFDVDREEANLAIGKVFKNAELAEHFDDGGVPQFGVNRRNHVFTLIPKKGFAL